MLPARKENHQRGSRAVCCCGFSEGKSIIFANQKTSQTHKITQMLHWLHFRNRQASQGRLLKPSKIAAGVGARDIFAFVSRHVFLRKIAQMLHWLYFRDTHGLPSTVSLFDPAGRGVQNTLQKCIKGPFCALSRAAP